MKSTVIRTAIMSSVITAVLVSALGLWAVPKIMNPQSPLAQYQGQDSVVQPAVYRGAAAQPGGDQHGGELEAERGRSRSHLNLRRFHILD